MSEVSYNPLPVSPDTHKDAENEKYHTFVNLALVLAAITGVELVLVYLPFNKAFIYSTLIALSLFKFGAVIAWFMHLIYDKLILTLAFMTGMAIAAGTYTAVLFLFSRSNVDFEAISGF